MLKEALIENGYTFKSDTDTEVLVNLIEYIRTSNNCTLLEAVQQALKQVIGAYAIAVVEKGNQDQIIAARRSSPMVIGIGDKEFSWHRTRRRSWNIRTRSSMSMTAR